MRGVADRFLLCVNMVGGVCRVKRIPIENGYASLSHCKGCDKFEVKE